MFSRVWEDEVNNIQLQEAAVSKQKRHLETEVSELTKLILGAKAGALKRAYEKQLEAKAEELENLEHTPINKIDLSIPYRTALEKATGLLRNPYSIWEKLSVHEKQQLFFFIFEEKLPFSRTERYRTAQTPYAIRLFEDFATQNTPMVEMGRVSLPSESISLFQLFTRLVR